jgi:hypothetical protein
VGRQRDWDQSKRIPKQNPFLRNQIDIPGAIRLGIVTVQEIGTESVDGNQNDVVRAVRKIKVNRPKNRQNDCGCNQEFLHKLLLLHPSHGFMETIAPCECAPSKTRNGQ